jgi:hypothetical protein
MFYFKHGDVLMQEEILSAGKFDIGSVGTTE